MKTKRNYDVCYVTWDTLVARSRHKPIMFELQFRKRMIPPEVIPSMLTYCMHITDNYFSITHLLDVRIASFSISLYIYAFVEECRWAFFSVKLTCMWVACLNWTTCRMFHLEKCNSIRIVAVLFLCFKQTAVSCSHFMI